MATAVVVAIAATPARAQVVPPVDFAPVVTYPTGGAQSRGATSADVDLDGDLDLATANAQSDDVSVLRNDGSGQFSADGLYAAGDGPVAITSADLNGDGYPDLAAVNAYANSVSVFLNAGNGTYGSAVTIAVGALPNSIVAGDFDGDDDADLATANLDDDTISVVAGDGAGGFGPATPVSVGGGPSGMATGDFGTADGRVDIVVANNDAESVSVLISLPGGGFDIRTVPDIAREPNSVAVADFNLDGRDDVAVHVNSIPSNGPDYVTVLVTDEFGFFQAPVSYPAVGVVLAGSGSIVAADFNVDGYPDVAVSGLQSDSLGVLLGDGTGALGTVRTFDANGPVDTMVAGDFAGGRAPDVVLAYIGGDVVALQRNTTVLPRLFNPVLPFRIADTRDGTGGVATVPLEPGQVLRIDPLGRAGVPSRGVGALALNVTAAEPTGAGYLTVYPCSGGAPNASNVNYRGGQIAEPNAAIVGLDGTGAFCISTSAPTDVIVDVTGWFLESSGFSARTPVRIADTRDGTGAPQAKLAAGAVLTVDVSDDRLVAAAALNVTAANTQDAGYLTVYPCTPQPPYASNVNYEPGEAAAPNAVVTGLDQDGRVCITTSTTVDVIVDLAGGFTTGAGFTGIVPRRMADTRDGTGGVAVGPLRLGSILRVPITNDPDVGAVALNVTATEASDSGFLTVFDCSGASPYASNVNYTAEELSSPNAVLTGVSPEGDICISASAPVFAVVDLTGTFSD